MLDFARQKKLTEFFEGRREFAYSDSKGLITIGIGRNINEGGRGLSEQEIELLFSNDLRRVEGELVENLPWLGTLASARRAVLADMCFCMGWPVFSKFKMLFSACQQGDWGRAIVSIQESKFAKDVGPRRTNPLSEMMRTGEWPPLCE